MEKNCLTCGESFEADQDWKTVCKRCYAKSKNPSGEGFSKFEKKPRSESMTRMSALKNAVELMRVMQDAGMLDKQEATIVKALNVANQFVDWIKAEDV